MTVKPLALALLSAIALSACMGHADMRADAPMASAPMSSDAAMPMSHEDPMVGGAAMYPSKDIIDNAVNSKDHTTLVAAVKAAGLVDTLLKPENKATLTKVLTYHVVPGRLDSAALAAKIQAGGGSATLTTVEGEPLKVWMQGDAVVVTDSKGNNATVTTADVYQKNGVIHVVDKVLMP